MLNSPMLSIFQHFHAIPLRSPLTPSGSSPDGEPRTVLPLNLIALPTRGGTTIWIPEMPSHSFDTVTVDQAPVTCDQIFACSPAVTPKRIAFMTEAVISDPSKT